MVITSQGWEELQMSDAYREGPVTREEHEALVKHTNDLADRLA